MAHLLYIPTILALGLIAGWVLGTRGATARIKDLEAEVEKLEKVAAKQRLAE